jgi:hypothetical protein
VALKLTEALNDDEVEVAYHMAVVVVDGDDDDEDSLDKEVLAYLEHHQ